MISVEIAGVGDEIYRFEIIRNHENLTTCRMDENSQFNLSMTASHE
jgi:hypothetical protein